MSESNPYNNIYYHNLLRQQVNHDLSLFEDMTDGARYIRKSIYGEGLESADYCDYVIIEKVPGADKPSRTFITAEQLKAMRLAPYYHEGYH